jgi:hypothetical protein
LRFYLVGLALIRDILQFNKRHFLNITIIFSNIMSIMALYGVAGSCHWHEKDICLGLMAAEKCFDCLTRLISWSCFTNHVVSIEHHIGDEIAPRQERGEPSRSLHRAKDAVKRYQRRGEGFRKDTSILE